MRFAPTVTNAQTELNWLRAQPLDLEGVQRLLTSIANDGRRAGEIVVRLLRRLHWDRRIDVFDPSVGKVIMNPQLRGG